MRKGNPVLDDMFGAMGIDPAGFENAFGEEKLTASQKAGKEAMEKCRAMLEKYASKEKPEGS